MSISFKAIYENGVIRPLEPVSLQEQQQVIVKIEDECRVDEPRNQETAYELFERCGLIGMIKDAPSDLSTNKKYFEGFGDSE